MDWINTPTVMEVDGRKSERSAPSGTPFTETCQSRVEIIYCDYWIEFPLSGNNRVNDGILP